MEREMEMEMERERDSKSNRTAAGVGGERSIEGRWAARAQWGRRGGMRWEGTVASLGAACRGTGIAGTEGGASPARPGDGRRLPLYLLVEDVLGLRLGQGVPVGYGLDGRVVPGGRPAGRADGWCHGGLADVVEDSPHRGGIGDEATMRMSAPQFGQTRGRDSNRRASSMAHR